LNLPAEEDHEQQREHEWSRIFGNGVDGMGDRLPKAAFTVWLDTFLVLGEDVRTCYIPSALCVR
jgi:hypothetical protein